MNLSKRRFILCLFLMIIFLTGCGIQVSTDLKIDEEFKGTRTVSCFIRKQDLKLHFQGDSTKIDRILENHCPSCLDYEKKEDSSGMTCTFTLHFSSLEDYEIQLGTILTFRPQIEYQGVNSFFSKSVDLTENFTSIDLLRWFEILLTDEYNISDHQLESLWDIKDTSVTWMDQTYPSSEDQIQISDHHQIPFDGITLYTEEKEDRTFTRKIQFSIPKETLDQYLIDLEQSFSRIKPSDATGVWTPTDSGKQYELTFQADDFESLSRKTNAAFDSLTTEAESLVSIADHPYLNLHLEYSETLDFSRFLSTEDGEVPVTYYFKPNSMTELDSELIQKEINNDFVPKPYEGGYYKIYSGNCDVLKIRTPETLHLPVSSYSIETTLLKKDQFKRVFRFYFADSLREEERELLTSALQTRSTEVCKIKLEQSDSGSYLSILQKGSKKELNASSEDLFGAGNEIKMLRQPISHLFSTKEHYDYRDTVNLTSFLGTDSIDGTYLFQNRLSDTDNFYLESDQATVHNPETTEGSSAKASLTGTSFQAIYSGSKPSYQWLFSLFMIFLFLAGLFLLKKGFRLDLDKIKEAFQRKNDSSTKEEAQN